MHPGQLRAARPEDNRIQLGCKKNARDRLVVETPGCCEPQCASTEDMKTMDGAIQQRNALLNWHSHGLSLFAKMPPGVKEEVDWSSRAPPLESSPPLPLLYKWHLGMCHI